jgi:alkaline phosphatase D
MIPSEFLRADLDRRRFLRTSSALALWPFLDLRMGEAADRTVRLSGDPFALGIASGDPTPDGVVLWTRLCPDPLQGGGMPPDDVRVQWQVAHDEGMQQIAAKGVATAAADWAHSVHVEVQGLQPDRAYWYQFKVGSDTSPVGRTRTAPAADALLDSLKFAFVSCQRFEDGYYTAYEHLLKDDLRAVIHLGDYMYENAPKAGTPRYFSAPEIFTLEDYRARHAVYRTDPHLQAAHAAFPFLVTWDDHEVDNNYAADAPEKALADPAEFLKRRANAYKAYYEHMPLRRSALPRGPAMDLYRRVAFGRLVAFSMLDTRQYRSDQPCGDGYQPVCEGVGDPRATMLGETQEAWLRDGLTASSARWNVLAQQVILAPVDFASNPLAGEGPTYSMDKWSGYEVPRTRLIQFLAERRISNPIVLTGDVHCNWVNDLKADFRNADSATVGTEFVGTSVTSTGDGSEKRENTDTVLSRNPFVKYFNSERGYVRCEITPAAWRADYRTVPFVTRPGAPCQTRATFVVENGRPGGVRDT